MAETQRLFVYEGKEYPDPDPKLTADQVKALLATSFPELANAETRTDKRPDGVEVVTFSRRVGTKG